MPEHRKGRVLVVDDEPDLLSILQRILSFVGFIVHTAESGVEALKVLEAEPEIDVLVTDVVMPVMDGLELTRRLFQMPRTPKPAVILITGDMRHLSAGEPLFEGCPVMRKPFDVMDLVRLVEQLSQRSPSQQ